MFYPYQKEPRMNEAQQRILGNVARALYELGDIFDEAALNLGR
jgi:hypothetical protein